MDSRGGLAARATSSGEEREGERKKKETIHRVNRLHNSSPITQKGSLDIHTPLEGIVMDSSERPKLREFGTPGPGWGPETFLKKKKKSGSRIPRSGQLEAL